MSLADFQDAFIRTLLAEEPASARNMTELPYLAQTALNAKRVNVCRARVADHLAQTVKAVYSTVQQIVGEAFILTAAQAYFREHPSVSADPLQQVEAFPAFLEQYPPAEAFPYLADVATLDLGLKKAFHAPESPRLSPSVFSQMNPEELATHCIRLHPACFWFSSEYAIYDIWRLYHAKKPLANINHRQAQDVILIRPQLTVEVYEIDAGFIKALDALDEGATLNDAFARGSEADFRFDTGSALQFLVTNGLITAFY